jgi:hypothetical protein
LNLIQSSKGSACESCLRGAAQSGAVPAVPGATNPSLPVDEEALMRLATPFDPIEVGEIDNFAFDFTADMGASSIVSTSWTCALAPYQTATDPAPQSRVLAASARTAIEVRSPIDGFLEMRNGFFSVASVGGMPISAVGGTYILEATAVLDDGRVLKLNATVLCSAPG